MKLGSLHGLSAPPRGLLLGRTLRWLCQSRAQHPHGITQPALHQQVRKLEGELGVTLLERVGRGHMVPTPAGDRLLQFVGPFFRDLGTVVESLRSGSYGGTLRLLAEPLLIRTLLPAWLTRLQKRHHDLR